MDPLGSVPALLGVSVLLNILRMIPAIPLQVSGIFLQACLNPGVIVFAVAGIVPPPLGVVVLFEDFLTNRAAAGLLPFAQLPVRKERSTTDAACFPFPLHSHPLIGDDKGTRKTRGIKGSRETRK
jgi:hypothetical protein